MNSAATAPLPLAPLEKAGEQRFTTFGSGSAAVAATFLHERQELLEGIFQANLVARSRRRGPPVQPVLRWLKIVDPGNSLNFQADGVE